MRRFFLAALLSLSALLLAVAPASAGPIGPTP